MNIQDAIKSGKRFRRPNFPKNRWYVYDGREQEMTIYDVALDSSGNPNPVGRYHPCRDDLLAGDWECEAKTVTITAKDIVDAWKRAEEKLHADTWSPPLYSILRELGLSDEGSK